MCHAKYGRWIRFKQKETGFEFVGSNNSSFHDELDKKMVTDLRDWLKTNPYNEALIEAGLSTLETQISSNKTCLITEQKETEEATNNKDDNSLNSKKLLNLNLRSFSTITEGYMDLVCQVSLI